MKKKTQKTCQFTWFKHEPNLYISETPQTRIIIEQFIELELFIKIGAYCNQADALRKATVETRVPSTPPNRKVGYVRT